jgi:catechol 2,3-dioxygenase-like lactoylglutathione lyase family enzyme
MTAVAHVGIAVPDLDSAERWYRDVLALDALGPHTRVRAGRGYDGAVAADVLGPDFGAFRQAHLAGANGVALELFEFEDRVDALAGLFHVCLTVGDVGAVAERVASSGGRRTSGVWPIFENEPFLTCYCRDPFGNIVELYSHSHERVYSNRASRP